MWEEVYAELLNKIRWSIASSVAAQGINLPFRTSKGIAGLFAGDVLRLLKLLEEKPDLDIYELAKSEQRSLDKVPN